MDVAVVFLPMQESLDEIIQAFCCSSTLLIRANTTKSIEPAAQRSGDAKTPKNKNRKRKNPRRCNGRLKGRDTGSNEVGKSLPKVYRATCITFVTKASPFTLGLYFGWNSHQGSKDSALLLKKCVERFLNGIPAKRMTLRSSFPNNLARNGTIFPWWRYVNKGSDGLGWVSRCKTKSTS